MPKTFTDDVAPVFPAAINGPLQVVVPGDLSSYFKIDPGAARIEAAGIARPMRRWTVPTARTTGVASFSTIDSALDGRSIGASSDAGLFSFPFAVPLDMDLTATCNLKVPVAPLADGGGGQVVRFELVTAYGKDGDTSMVTETVTYDWTTPAGWSTQDLKLVTLDAGSGSTYAGNKFEASDIIGVLVRRLGSAAQDTFSQSLIMATSFVFEYMAKQV